MQIEMHTVIFLCTQTEQTCELKPPDFENSGYFGWKPWQPFKVDKREDYKGKWRIAPPQREDQEFK